MTDTQYCLCCGKILGVNPENQQWHTSCSRRFFGTPTLPALDISTGTLEGFAMIAVNEGTTVTGVQKKMSLHLHSEDRHKRLTLVGYPSGYILKPPAAEYPELPELEHALMSFAEAVGIHTVPHALIRLASGELSYITRRIDRTFSRRKNGENRKIDMEDFCQLSLRLTEDKYKGSYEQCGKIISQYSSRPGLDLADFFYLILFSFATGNADMHLKNFSLVDSASGPVLSPAYDLVPTCLLIPDDKEETALTVNGKKSHLTANDFQILGNNLGLLPKVIHNLMDKAASLADMLAASSALNVLPASREAELSDLIIERCSRLRPKRS